jgi:hypothetical protein
VNQCPVTATSASQCSPTATAATGTPSNPINSVSSAVLPNHNVLHAYSQGDLTVQFPTVANNVATCTPGSTISNPMTCVFTIAIDSVPAPSVPGQLFVDNSPPVIAAGGSNVGIVFTTCGNSLPITTPSKVNECAKPQVACYASTDNGASWSLISSFVTGIRTYKPSLTADPAGNLYGVFLNTGTDKTGQSFQLNEFHIPSNLTSTTVSPITTKPIDPSAGFSSGGTSWGSPAIAVHGTVAYATFTTTNATPGTWGPNTGLPEQTNAVVRITDP